MSKIKKIWAREVLDSRGNPTIFVEVTTESGIKGKAIVPSGASTGALEALELRDGSVDTPLGRKYASNWYGGKGVMTAVDNVNLRLAPSLIGMEVTNQKLLDQKLIDLDGTVNKSRYGANALLGISLASLKAGAKVKRVPLYTYIGGSKATRLPMPMLNVINGGEHATNTLDFQEFMIMPLSAKSFREALQMSNKVFHTLAKLLKQAGHGLQVGDEGGFAPDLRSHEEALDFLVKAIRDAGFEPATKGSKAVAIALDPAVSEIYDGSVYRFKKLEKAIKEQKHGFEKMKNVKVSFTSSELIDYLSALVKKYPIVSIEDGMAESDWGGFSKMTKLLGSKIQVMGDDLTVTNSGLLQKAIDQKAINSILIKLNQIGTYSETIETINLAQKSGMNAIISHRSGETEDTTIADLAVGMATGQIKTGSVSRTDRIAKYNRLLEIEEELGSAATFFGIKTFSNF